MVMTTSRKDNPLSDDYFDNAIDHCRLPVYFKIQEYQSGHAALTGCNSKILSNLGGTAHYKRKKKDHETRTDESIERNIRRMKKRVREACKRFSPDHMVTLTTKQNETNFCNSLEQFRELVKKLKKENLLDCYVAVPEQQKRGSWHWHIAVKGYVDTKKWRELWQSLTGGKGTGSVNATYNGNYNSIESTEYMINYLVKYISKSINDSTDIKIIRSRNLPPVDIRKGFCGSLTWIVKLVKEGYVFRSHWFSDDNDVNYFELYRRHEQSFQYISFMYETDNDGMKFAEFNPADRQQVNMSIAVLFELDNF